MPFNTTSNQPPIPVQPSINPGNLNALNTDGLIGGGQQVKNPLHSASTIITKLRANIAQALLLAANPATAQPLIAPTNWVTATAYSKGQSVTNGGNVYTAIVGGTSAAAPTVTTTGPITDGTVQWYYMGPSFSSSASAPTFTNQPAANKYTGTYWTNTLNTRNDGTVNVLDDTNFLVTGGPVSATGAQNGWTGAANSNSIMFQVSFMTDETSFQIEITGSANPVFQIYVNGIPLTLGYGSLNTNGQSINYAQLVFATKAVRLITVELPGNNGFWGVLTNSKTSKVWAPYLSNSVRLAIAGSSIISGSAQHPVTNSLGWGSLMSKLLNCVDYWQDSNGGGTGYINPGTSANFISPLRLNSLVAYAPDVVVIAGGGINDSALPGITTAIEQAAIVLYLQTLRAALPNALILIIGCEAGNKGPTPIIFAMELAAQQAVAQMNDPLIQFIPQSSTNAAKAWISGTGTTAAPNTSGNSDIYIGADGTHPVQAGVLYYAQQSANGIINAVNSTNL